MVQLVMFTSHALRDPMTDQHLRRGWQVRLPRLGVQWLGVCHGP